MPRILDLSDPSDEWGASKAGVTRVFDFDDTPSEARVAALVEAVPLGKAKPVYDAIVWLASRCDHAHAHDGQGFNRMDSELGHSFAKTINRYGRLYSSRQFEIAKRIARRYRAQLSAGGFDLDPILTASFDARPVSPAAATVAIIGKVLTIGEKALKIERVSDLKVDWWPRSQMAKISVEGGPEDHILAVSDVRAGDVIHFNAPLWLCKKKGVA